MVCTSALLSVSLFALLFYKSRQGLNASKATNYNEVCTFSRRAVFAVVGLMAVVTYKAFYDFSLESNK